MKPDQFVEYYCENCKKQTSQRKEQSPPTCLYCMDQMNLIKPDNKPVIIIVRGGCAEVYDQPDEVQVVIVDMDGDYSWYCPSCRNAWTGPSQDEQDVLQGIIEDDFVCPCDVCRSNQ